MNYQLGWGDGEPLRRTRPGRKDAGWYVPWYPATDSNGTEGWVVCRKYSKRGTPASYIKTVAVPVAELREAV